MIGPEGFSIAAAVAPLGVPPTSSNEVVGSVLNLTTLIVFIGGLAGFLINLVAIIVASYKMGGAVKEFKSIGLQQAKEITELKNTVSGVAELITKWAITNERLDGMSMRLGRAEVQIDELRRGEGLILPLEGKRYYPSREG